MKTTSAQQEFEKRFGAIPPANPVAGFGLMLNFYEAVRTDDVAIDSDGDMLLFQWGTYDWGDGRRFEVGLARQLIRGDGEDDDIWQLHLTYFAPPSDDTATLGAGNSWCPTPAELPAFRDQVLNHAAVSAIANRSDGQVELRFECAG